MLKTSFIYVVLKVKSLTCKMGICRVYQQNIEGKENNQKKKIQELIFASAPKLQEKTVKVVETKMTDEDEDPA